ncbi:unknown [Salmonella phage FelixO1]|uniref:Uncharacterized protein n=1 Tax=Salmonella phage Felix O1 (isolate Felix O1-VT1) TaxID=1283336 RepID=Q6KGN8_BPFO1|nr:unknown [Salmonella phage FelixO1]
MYVSATCLVLSFLLDGFKRPPYSFLIASSTTDQIISSVISSYRSSSRSSEKSQIGKTTCTLLINE